MREANGSWFLLDSAETDDFGQPLTQGPHSTLKLVKEALAGARKTTPLPRSRTAVTEKPPPKARRVAKAATPPHAPSESEPERTWIDALPRAEATEVRRLVRALEMEGLADADELVRRDRDGLMPAVATQLIERRLDALVDELPKDGRDAARRLIRRVAEILSAEGSTLRAPLPRWTLVEIGPRDEPQNRRIVVRPR